MMRTGGCRRGGERARIAGVRRRRRARPRRCTRTRCWRSRPSRASRPLGVAVAAAAVLAFAGCGSGASGGDTGLTVLAPARERASAASEHAAAFASWRRALAAAAACERLPGDDERARCFAPIAIEPGQALAETLQVAFVAAPVGPCRPALRRVRAAAGAVGDELVILELLGRQLAAAPESLAQARRAAEQRLRGYEAAWKAMNETCGG
jgi:hypothetical protein